MEIRSDKWSVCGKSIGDQASNIWSEGMKQRVRKRSDNINMTREVFTTLRKAIDEREEQTIGDIKEAAYRKWGKIRWAELSRFLRVLQKFSREYLAIVKRETLLVKAPHKIFP